MSKSREELGQMDYDFIIILPTSLMASEVIEFMRGDYSGARRITKVSYCTVALNCGSTSCDSGATSAGYYLQFLEW